MICEDAPIDDSIRSIHPDDVRSPSSPRWRCASFRILIDIHKIDFIQSYSSNQCSSDWCPSDRFHVATLFERSWFQSIKSVSRSNRYHPIDFIRRGFHQLMIPIHCQRCWTVCAPHLLILSSNWSFHPINSWDFIWEWFHPTMIWNNNESIWSLIPSNQWFHLIHPICDI